MRAFLRLLACFCFFQISVASAAQAGDSSRISLREVRQGFRDSVVLARVRPGVSSESVRSTEAALGLDLERTIGPRGVVRVLRSGEDGDEPQLAKLLLDSGLYAYAEPDYIRHRLAVPNDPRFAEQWSLRNTGQTGGKAGADIGAVAAWDIRSDASNVVVAVIDTGIRTTHEDLAGNLWVNEAEIPGNGVDDDGNGYIDDVHGINALVDRGQPGSGDPSDDQGHGTAVSGVIAAVGNNGKGITGVAWRTRLMALKFDDRDRTSDGSSFASNLIECVEYAVAHGARIVNLSYGGASFSHAEYEMFKAAGEAGVIVVAAAGNNGVPNDIATSYPAAYALPNMLAVANSDENDGLAPSSTYGGMVELAAPGSLLLLCSHTGDDEYFVATGTSFSSPMVAGALALMSAQFPGESPRQLINRLLRTVDRLPALSGKVTTSGRLNLARALVSTSNRPFNDDFADRAVLAGDHILTRADNTGATSESGESNHGGAGGRSIWWSWTAPRAGNATVDTRDSAIDTLLAVYKGDTLESLTLVQANDNAGGGTASRLAFEAEAGVTYHFAVDGKAGAQGTVRLGVSLLPSNDLFEGAEVLTGVSVQITGNNINASRESGEPTIMAGNDAGVGATVWYRWTAVSSDGFTVAVQTDSFTPVVAVYQKSNGDVLSLVKSARTGISFDAVAGQTYWIAVDSLAPNAGTFVLSLLQSYAILPFGGMISSSIAIDATASLACVNDGGFVLFLGATGEVWVKRLPGSVDVSTPTFGPDGTLYVATTLGLFALDRQGEIKWSRRFDPGISGSPSVAADGTVYVHVDDDALYAYTPSGKERWRCPIPGVSFSSPSIGADGTVYLGSDDGHVYAVAALDGSVQWKFNTGGEVYASVAISGDGTLYIGNLEGRFYAITPAGAQKWMYTAGGGISSSAALGGDGSVFFGSYDHKVYALTEAGTLRWTYTTGDEIRASSPVVDLAGRVWIGSYDGYVHAVNPDGQAFQTYPTGGVIRGSPVLDLGTLLWASADGNIYLVETNSMPAQSAWPMHRQNRTRTGRNNPISAPIVLSETVTRNIVAGETVQLAIHVEGYGFMSFQWYRNGAPIAGGTESTLTIENASATDAGTYTVIIANPFGNVSTVAARLTFVDSGTSDSRIANLSARALAGADERTLIVGFSLSAGQGTKSMLIRGVGPTLAEKPFGLPNTLQDPRVLLFQESTVIFENDDWGGDATILSRNNELGAFPFIDGSRDSAMIRDLSPGTYTAHITAGSGNRSGVALAEFYDGGNANGLAGPRLVNISARSDAGGDTETLIAGFVIAGTAPRTVLVRAIGPALGAEPFNLPGVMPDPVLVLYDSGQNIVGSNDDWSAEGNADELESVMSRVGAFSLQRNSSDAAMLVTLAPGPYTAVVLDYNGARGVALAEVYDGE